MSTTLAIQDARVTIAGQFVPELSPFDQIKIETEDGERWSLRDLQRLMDYSTYQKVKVPFERALASARNVKMDVDLHFNRSVKDPLPGQPGSSSEDYVLTREAAYLVAMNGDPNKEAIALAQAYFANQTILAEKVQRKLALTPEQLAFAVESKAALESRT